MPRPNKATLSDQSMEAAFRQGFEEGVVQAGMQVFYEFSAVFEGTELRRVQFADISQALSEAGSMLLNGVGVSVTITAIATEQPGQAAVGPAEDVIDAEVVEDPAG